MINKPADYIYSVANVALVDVTDKHFSEQFSKNWWLIYAIINICSVVNSTESHLPLLSDITLIVGLTLLSGLSLVFLTDVVACRIVDKYEGNK